MEVCLNMVIWLCYSIFIIYGDLINYVKYGYDVLLFI